jgi:acyl carrier protein
VSGPGLARGYLNQAELTNQKFVTDPFREGQRMYRTGDKGRWLDNNDVEFLGRKDEQVKIRGYRIEPGEIESVLQKHEQVLQAVAMVRESASGNQLVAYVVGRGDGLDIPGLRSHAAKWLPVYMLPDHYVELAELPLNRSGKIDKASLPSPNDMSEGEYVAPRTPIETRLVEMWSEVLGMDKYKLSIRDNFFNLGGHSLKVIQLMARIRKEFEVNPGIDSLFKNPTVEFLASEIEKTHLVNAEIPQLENADNIENFHV